MNDDTPIFPVAAYDVGPILQYGIVVFRPHFLASPTQRPDEAETGRYYALTVVQAEALVRSLQTAIDTVKKSPPSAPRDELN